MPSRLAFGNVSVVVLVGCSPIARPSPRTDLALGRRGHGAAGSSLLHSVCWREPVRGTRERAESDEIVDYYLVNPIMYLALEAEYQ